MKFKISAAVRSKMETKHAVNVKELSECFENRDGLDLFDTRAKNLTDPLTRWFLAHTNHCRLLKVVFIPVGDTIEIKTVYPPSQTEIAIYKKHGYPK